MPTSTIALVEAVRLGSTQQARTAFLDFMVDGESMRADLSRRGFDDLVGPLWTSEQGQLLWPGTVARLTGRAPGDVPGERVSVFVCGECGDLGCGAITVRLTVSDEEVIWSEWGYQNNYEDEIYRVRLDDLPSLVFDRGQYDAVLTAPLDQPGDARHKCRCRAPRRARHPAIGCTPRERIKPWSGRPFAANCS